MKPSHGTEAVMGGKLKGATDATDYFYFLCPTCGADRILRILDYSIDREETGNAHNPDLKAKAKRTFVIRLEVACEDCRFRDVVKVGNVGWQGGSLHEAQKR